LLRDDDMGSFGVHKVENYMLSEPRKAHS
jgi:hypothetical protein